MIKELAWLWRSGENAEQILKHGEIRRVTKSRQSRFESSSRAILF